MSAWRRADAPHGDPPFRCPPLLGMVTPTDDGDANVLPGSAALLPQGHIFFSDTVEEDTDPDTSADAAAVIEGGVCSESLGKLLKKQ